MNWPESHSKMSCQPKLLLFRISLIIVLYFLQGVILGFISSVPIFLASHHASWTQQSTFNWVQYPFSLKILWAPIIDSIYIRRFGRPLTWLIPIQFFIGLILLILSFYIQDLIDNLQLNILTIVLFILCFLIASQDIAVDGWSIALFNDINPQWASTCQIIGQMTGVCVGSSLLMIFESTEFSNEYIRRVFSFAYQSYGLMSLGQFTFIWGILFVVVSVIMIGFILAKNVCRTKKIEDETHSSLPLLQTYLSIYKLLRKRCILQLCFLLFTHHIGFAATVKMTELTLVEYGVSRHTLALISLSLLIVNLIIPIIFRKTRRPLIWLSRGYIPRLFVGVLLAIYIYFTSKIIGTPYFYPILICLFCLNEIFVSTMTLSIAGASAKVSEVSIAGTYMTLLLTISNLGRSISSSIALYTADYLPKLHAYSIEVLICFLLGLIWISLTYRLFRRLDELPSEQWSLNFKCPSSSLSSVTSSHPIILEGSVNVISYSF